jgi:uncharacterized membrane protein YjjP (DUF1212 family)
MRIDPSTIPFAETAPADEGDPAVAFAIKIAAALHRFGTPAHRLEAAFERICERLGLDAQIFSLPTGIIASFGRDGRQQMSLTRVPPGDVDLEKMVRLDALAGRVVEGHVTPRDGLALVDEIVAAPPRYGSALTALCFGLASATNARFVGGGWREVVVAGAIGTAVGVLLVLVKRSPASGRVFEPVAGALATVAALVASAAMPPVSVYIATLAGVIVLLPGLTVTVAVNEMATRNVVSGTSRLVAAAVLFLQLGFGVVVGGQTIGLLPGASFAEIPIPLPGWTEAAALCVSPLVLGVIFKARPRDFGWVALGAALAFGGARAGAHMFGAQFGVCVGAFALGIGSNLCARLLDRPSAVVTVPGLMLLVPGGVGFGSIRKFLDNDVVTGVDAAFTMAMIAVALVTGLLLANAVVPPRRAL